MRTREKSINAEERNKCAIQLLIFSPSILSFQRAEWESKIVPHKQSLSLSHLHGHVLFHRPGLFERNSRLRTINPSNVREDKDTINQICSALFLFPRTMINGWISFSSPFRRYFRVSSSTLGSCA